MERFKKGDIARIIEDEQRAPTFDEAKAIWAYINRITRAGRDNEAELNRLGVDLGKANARVVSMLERIDLAEKVVVAANALLNTIDGPDGFENEADALLVTIDRWDGAK